MAKDDDPLAPYKVYEGDETRRAQQLLESQAANSDLSRYFIIMDNLERVVS